MLKWVDNTERWLAGNCRASKVFTWGFIIVIFSIIIIIALI